MVDFIVFKIEWSTLSSSTILVLLCVCYLLVWLGVVGCEGVASSFVGFDDDLFRVVLVDARDPSTVNWTPDAVKYKCIYFFLLVNR